MKRRFCFLFALILVFSSCGSVQRENQEQKTFCKIDDYAEQIQFEGFETKAVSIIDVLDKKVFFSDVGHDNYESYYIYDVDNKTISFIGTVPYGKASSGITIMMPPASLIVTSLDKRENELQRSISIFDGNEGKSFLYDAQPITEKDSPFIYLSKIDENSFLSTELNETNSRLKLHNLETGSISTLLQCEVQKNPNGDVTGRVIVNAAVSNGTILLLVNELRKESVFVIEQYSLEGEYLKTLNSEACNYLFEETAPLWIFAIQDFLILYNWDMESAIFKMEGNEIRKINCAENLRIGSGGLSNCASSNNLNFLYLLRQNPDRDNQLYAIDLKTEEIKNVILEKQGYHIYYTVMAENGDVVLIYEKEDADVSDTQTMAAYYLEKETIENLLRNVQIMPVGIS